MTHFFKYLRDGSTGEWYCDREISQQQFEQSWLQYWARVKKGLNR